MFTVAFIDLEKQQATLFQISQGKISDGFIKNQRIIFGYKQRCMRFEIRYVGMLGKFSKAAQGIMMVHAQQAPIDFDFIASVAKESGVADDLCEQIKGANTANQVADWIVKSGHSSFFDRMSRYCCEQVSKYIGGGIRIDTRLVTLDGAYLGGAVIDG